jgi:hypothetical protein
MTTPTTAPTGDGAAGATGGGKPSGATRESLTYYTKDGRLRKAARPVPVDQYGAIAATRFECRRCKAAGWFSINLKGVPACSRCGRRMTVKPVEDAPLLPWRDLWVACRWRLAPVAAVGGLGVVGAGAAGAGVPGLVLAGAAPAVGVVGARVAKRRLVKDAARRGRIDVEDDGADRRIRAAIARQARAVGYTAAAGTGWLGLAAELGVDPHTGSGKAALLALTAVGVLPSASWWRRLRDKETAPVAAPDEPAIEAAALLDPTEQQIRHIWDTIVAVKGGRLPGTSLEDWYRLPGGWGATIVGPIGVYESDHYASAIGKIASAFSVRKSMVSVMPDPDDENRAMLMVQRSSPLKDVVRWAGPDSIDAANGVAPVALYADSTPVMYEIFRENWGSPHDFLCGTTGAGKSEALSSLLLIDRWAHHTGPDGTKHGLVADLLIDPQQGQSYEPFMDDLAAPVACSIEEAMLVVEAFRSEMLRRNQYLSKRGWRDSSGVLHRAEWVDKRGRTRFGRKWWDPRIDGPILTLNIDEAHEFLSVKAFAALITAGARMYRKCGMRIRVVTHTPLLTDLGGSMALRSMLTGGFVWVGRTADRLSGPTAFNGRLPADPCSLPLDPGMCFVLGGAASKPMTARTMWEPDYLDWIRDADDRPIGYPAALPAVTLEAFGPEFVRWVEARANDEDWVPESKVEQAVQEQDGRCADHVLSALLAQTKPVDMTELDEFMRGNGWVFSTRTIREALKKLRDAGLVVSSGGRHEVTAGCRADAEAQLAEQFDGAAR